jgi:uncharacterized membrane protein YgdD (TMEM256/DUF423 family)
MFLSVAFGAFGAHALKSKLTPEMLTIFEVGVRYQTYHALGLFVVAWFSERNFSIVLPAAGWFFVAGIILFSGSLYALSLTGTRWFGAITPIGGLCFLIGWACIAWSVLGRRA